MVTPSLLKLRRIVRPRPISFHLPAVPKMHRANAANAHDVVDHPLNHQRVSNSQYRPFNLLNWATFLRERAPPVVFLLLAAGPCFSGLLLLEGAIDKEKLIWAIFGQLILILTVRVMDDVKDYQLDLVVHPDRPLPRGLIKYDEVITVINMVLAAMSLYAGMLAWRFTLSVGLTFGLQVIFAYLMYIEFGIGKWLETKVFLYALTHQISIYFGSFFLCALAETDWYSYVGFLIGSVAFSGFFTYEICRKLDPTLPLMKGTYLVVYGKWVTFAMATGTISVGVVSSYILGMSWFLWPIEVFMIISLFGLFLIQSPVPGTKVHKPVEAFAVLYLLLHMWAGYITSFW